ncbi:hypothetical protein ABE444_02060 [Brevundimonas pondensis]|mgnify:CR=1|uniref:hypothetical protein n=1 Tax=Brevundimonas pondensis TaxID=2774189 RepID=UPI0032083921
MFGITTAKDFRSKASRDNAALQSDIANADYAINAVLSAYHLHEWVWGRSLKASSPISVRGTMLREKKDWVAWLDANFPHFSLLQDLANGSKHCVPVSAESVDGYGEGPWGIGPFGVPYLLIDLGSEKQVEDRWRVASDVLQDANDFWAELGAEFNF